MDYKERGQDTRIARFLSIDPLTTKYPELTPYQFASNTPIMGIDMDGLEIMPHTNSMFRMRYTGMVTSFKTVDGRFTAHLVPSYTVDQISENIPKAIRNDEGRVKYDIGPPMGEYGGPKPGSYIGGEPIPDFQGKTSDGGDPDQTPSSMGNRNATNGYTAEKSPNAAKAAAVLEAKKIIDNFSNISIWNGTGDAWKNQQDFYLATNMVDASQKKISTTFTSGQGRVDLINFILDGTFPTSYNLAGKTPEEVRRTTQYMLDIMKTAEAILAQYNRSLTEKSKESKSDIQKINRQNGGKGQ